MVTSWRWSWSRDSSYSTVVVTSNAVMSLCDLLASTACMFRRNHDTARVRLAYLNVRILGSVWSSVCFGITRGLNNTKAGILWWAYGLENESCWSRKLTYPIVLQHRSNRMCTSSRSSWKRTCIGSSTPGSASLTSIPNTFFIRSSVRSSISILLPCCTEISSLPMCCWTL